MPMHMPARTNSSFTGPSGSAGGTNEAAKSTHTDINDDALRHEQDGHLFSPPNGVLVAQMERCRSSRSCRRSYLPSAATFITGARQPYLFRQASFSSKWLKQLSLCGLELGFIGVHQSRCGILDATRNALVSSRSAATNHDGGICCRARWTRLKCLLLRPNCRRRQGQCGSSLLRTATLAERTSWSSRSNRSSRRR